MKVFLKKGIIALIFLTTFCIFPIMASAVDDNYIEHNYYNQAGFYPRLTTYEIGGNSSILASLRVDFREPHNLQRVVGSYSSADISYYTGNNESTLITINGLNYYENVTSVVFSKYSNILFKNVGFIGHLYGIKNDIVFNSLNYIKDSNGKALVNNRFEITFNEDYFTYFKSDISITDSSGKSVNFNAIKEDNKLILTPLQMQYGEQYTVSYIVTDTENNKNYSNNFTFNTEDFDFKFLNISDSEFVKGDTIVLSFNDIIISKDISNLVSVFKGATSVKPIISVLEDKILIDTSKFDFDTLYSIKISKELECSKNATLLQDIEKDIFIKVDEIPIKLESSPLYLFDNNVSLKFNKALKSASFNFVNSYGQALESTYSINGEYLSIRVTDERFVSKDSYTLTITDLVCVNDTNITSPIVIKFKKVMQTGNEGIDTVLSGILQMIEASKSNGVIIVVIAITIGILFLVSKFIWQIAKRWLKNL